MMLVITVVLGAGAVIVWNIENQVPSLSYNDFIVKLNKNEIVKVRLTASEIFSTDIFDRQYTSFVPNIPELVPELLKKNVIISGDAKAVFPWENFLYIGLPLIFILIAWYSLLKQQEPEEESENFGSKKAVNFQKGGKLVTFRDIAGLAETKDELLEIIDFLQKPKRFSSLGAILPKGILFQGPPGTGKTLLAMAIAGEAGVPFYSISGSDFVEMFVGVGASRVRDLFKEAKQNSPCIIFIDEIDAVGGHRGSGSTSAGQDERSQTLNALLVEMDGFSSDETVIILAATNRPDILDPALLRPGRFDRQINILPPDVAGRLKILEVHGRKVALAENVDLSDIARATPGFTGAELASLVNEAAIVAGRNRKKAVDLLDFDAAKDRILMGVERKNMVISTKDRQTMAIHEAGHAILAQLLPDADPIHKITIIPRGRALGHTLQLPMADRHAFPKEHLLSRITILLGGRVAEEICLDQQTTGAEDDFQQAFKIASKMVCRWGMNPKIGTVSYEESDSGFLGEGGAHSKISEETARTIDREVKKIIDACYDKARSILGEEKHYLEKLAELLLVNETFDFEEMEIVYRYSHKTKIKEQETEKSAETKT